MIAYSMLNNTKNITNKNTSNPIVANKIIVNIMFNCLRDA